MTKKIKTNPLEDQLKRTLADYQNLVKRVNDEKNAFVKFANSQLLRELLPVLDDLERAMVHLADPGLQLAIDNFKTVLAKEEVTEIKLLGTVFDPQTAECVELVKGEKNKIINIVQKGYALAGKVLRPARVKVGQGG